MSNKIKGPKVLFLDIETSPMEVYTWGIFQQFIPPDRIKKDWNIIAWAAKWRDSDKIMYSDQRNAKNFSKDKKLLRGMWKLMNEADIIITQNGVRFDEKKLNARFLINDFDPPSSYSHIDTARTAKHKFGFTSNSLAYLTKTLNTKHKKLEHKKYPGNKLWDECLAGNLDAWRDMEKYNKHDVLALQDVFEIFKSWDNKSPNFNIYHDSNENVCVCGSTKFKKNGFKYKSLSKYQRYQCKKCKKEFRSGVNLLSTEKRSSMLRTN